MIDPDVWMRPDIKDKYGFKYWEYILCYVDDILRKSENPMQTMKGIQSKLKLKDDKMEKPDVYLGAELFTMYNEQGDEYWAMLSDKQCADMVKKVEVTLTKKGLKLQK